MQNRRFSFTDPAIRNLKAPGYYWDTNLSAFGIAVGARAKTFVVVHKGGRRIKLGRYLNLSIQDARKKAGRIIFGTDVAAERAASPIVLDAVTQFIEHQQLATKPRTAHEYNRLLQAHFLPKFGKRTLDKIATADILDITDNLLETPTEAIHAHAAIKRFFNWAIQRRLIATSPLTGLPLPAKPTDRDRVLTNDELIHVYQAARQMGFPFGFIILICIHTLMRRSEVGALKWSYISDDFITLPAAITKNGRPHAIPNLIGENLKLIPRTSEHLFPSGADTPFSAWSKNKKKLDKLCGVSDWVIHDLRRTGRSRLAEWECCSPEIAERILGHATAQTRLERIYNRWSHLPQMRAGLERYEERLAALISAK